MLRRVLWLLPLVLLAAHAFLRVGPGEHQRGYDQAVHDLQEVRQRLGWASEIDGSILNRVQYLPPSHDKSERWNEGYRQAIEDQFTTTRR